MMVFLWPLEGARSPRDLSRSRRLPILGPECSKIESNHTEGKKKKKILLNTDLGEILRKSGFYILVRLPLQS